MRGHCSAIIFGTAGKSGCPTKAHGFACNTGRSRCKACCADWRPSVGLCQEYLQASCFLRQSWGTGRNQPELAVRENWLDRHLSTCVKQASSTSSSLHSSTLTSDPVHCKFFIATGDPLDPQMLAPHIDCKNAVTKLTTSHICRIAVYAAHSSVPPPFITISSTPT